MNDDISSENNEVDEDGFIITNLESVHDLDSRFRTDARYLARGPFRVHSPSTPSWRWGYRLEQVGNHLVFQDGTALGRTVLSDGMSMRASDDGTIIWLFGFEDDGLTVLTLSTAEIEDYRAAAPAQIAITSFNDGALVMMAELEKLRGAQFGLDFDSVLTSRLGIVFLDDAGMSTFGLHRFDRKGHVLRRLDGRWQECDFSAESKSVGEGQELLMSPFLESGVADYDAASHGGRKMIPLRRIDQFIYPRFDIDGTEDWSALFDEWEIVS